MNVTAVLKVETPSSSAHDVDLLDSNSGPCWTRHTVSGVTIRQGWTLAPSSLVHAKVLISLAQMHRSETPAAMSQSNPPSAQHPPPSVTQVLRWRVASAALSARLPIAISEASNLMFRRMQLLSASSHKLAG